MSGEIAAMWQICERRAQRGERARAASRPAAQPSNLAQSWASVNGAARLPAGQGTAVSKRRPSFEHDLDLGRELALGLVDRVAVDARVERADFGAQRRPRR